MEYLKQYNESPNNISGEHTKEAFGHMPSTKMIFKKVIAIVLLAHWGIDSHKIKNDNIRAGEMCRTVPPQVIMVLRQVR